MSCDVSFRAKVPSAIVGGTTHATNETQFLDAAGDPLKVTIAASKVSGQLITLKIVGRVTGGTTTNFTLNIAHGTSSTYSSNTTIATSGAVAVDSASTNFAYIVRLVWDSTSLKLAGVSGDGWMGLTPTIHTKAVTTLRTAIAATANLGFTLTGTFSASNANNAAYITQFDLEV